MTVKYLLFILFALEIFCIKNVYTQDTTAIREFLAVESLTNQVIKFSDVKFANTTEFEGEIYGFKNGEKVLIGEYLPFDTFFVSTKDYDRIYFDFVFIDNTGKSELIDNFYYELAENKLFEFEAFPIMPMSGAELIVGNSDLKNIAGKMLYEIIVGDDIDPKRIKVVPKEDAVLYIDVMKIDSTKYRIKLKDKNEFYSNLSSDIKSKWKKGEELKFPIGVNLSDTVVTQHKASIQYLLVKRKKPKKIKS